MGKPEHQWTSEQLVEEHYAALFRYGYRLTGSVSEAEDLTQEAFCKAHVHLDQLREPGRARSWLFSILRNEYLHRVRGEKPTMVHLESLDVLPDLSASENLPEVDPEQLQQALSELPEEFRTPIILYYFSEFSYRDIAEQMELPLGTVMSRLARAKGHLRARLTRAEPGESRSSGRKHNGM